MSFPQPSADQYAIRGYQYFRLNTLLTSPGDIYESSQSGHGIAVGPDSDLANINIAYFDDQVETFMARTTISPLRAFVGRIDARNEAVYTPAGRAAKILFWSADIYDPNYRPISKPAAFGGDDEILFVAPRLDVIEYFKPIASITPGRTDREYAFQDYPVVLSRFYLVLPYYGRRYAYCELTNRNQVEPNTFGIVGVNYAITQDGLPAPAVAYHQETTLLAPTEVTANAQATRIIRATTDGMFDALVISLTNAGPAPLRVVMSDREP